VKIGILRFFGKSDVLWAILPIYSSSSCANDAISIFVYSYRCLHLMNYWSNHY